MFEITKSNFLKMSAIVETKSLDPLLFSSKSLMFSGSTPFGLLTAHPVVLGTTM